MIERNVDVGLMTTFKISCLAKYFSAPKSVEELLDAIHWAEANDIERVLLGGGANTLFVSNPYNGLVISTKELKHIKLISDNVVDVGAGVDIETLGQFLIEHELSGMEFAGGLPGSLGGAVCMNARAYGAEYSELVLNVTFLDESLKVTTNDISLLGYAYKQSIFLNNNNLIVLSAQLRFRKKSKAEIAAEWEKNRLDRISKEQFTFPSAGCVFKNCYDIGIPTGKIIDDLGLKGKILGGAKVFEKHANFIVNTGNAKATDVLSLIELVEKEVWDKRKIRLEREVRVII